MKVEYWRLEPFLEMAIKSFRREKKGIEGG